MQLSLCLPGSPKGRSQATQLAARQAEAEVEAEAEAEAVAEAQAAKLVGHKAPPTTHSSVGAHAVTAQRGG